MPACHTRPVIPSSGSRTGSSRSRVVFPRIKHGARGESRAGASFCAVSTGGHSFQVSNSSWNNYFRDKFKCTYNHSRSWKTFRERFLSEAGAIVKYWGADHPLTLIIGMLNTCSFKEFVLKALQRFYAWMFMFLCSKKIICPLSNKPQLWCYFIHA